MKNIKMPASAMNIPVMEARCGTLVAPDESPPSPPSPPLPEKPPPPVPLSEGISSISSVTIVPGIALLQRLLGPWQILACGPGRLLHYFTRATCDGSTHCGMKSSAAPGTLNSYGPRYTLGYWPRKLSMGGGESVSHSRVVAFQGFLEAFGPNFKL